MLPIFALIAAGAAFGRYTRLSEAGVGLLNSFVIWLALPALLFPAIAEAKWSELIQPHFLLAQTISLAGIFILSLLLAAKGRTLARRAVDALAASYPNAGFLGIPLVQSLLGAEAVAPAIVVTILTVSVQFAATLALVEYDLNRGGGMAATLVKVGRSLIRNPLIFSPILGALYAVTGLPVPEPVDHFLHMLSGAATPVALVAIGAFLVLPRPERGAVAGGGELTKALVLKLIAQPALTAALVLTILPMPPIWAAAAIVLSALPTGTGAFMVAQLYRQDVALASRAILVSTVLSVITVSLVAMWVVP